ncbi:hypothetical protein BpHYR1_021461, partial [Brachionus plicatilis]
MYSIMRVYLILLLISVVLPFSIDSKAINDAKIVKQRCCSCPPNDSGFGCSICCTNVQCQ